MPRKKGFGESFATGIGSTLPGAASIAMKEELAALNAPEKDPFDVALTRAMKIAQIKALNSGKFAAFADPDTGQVRLSPTELPKNTQVITEPQARVDAKTQTQLQKLNVLEASLNQLEGELQKSAVGPVKGRVAGIKAVFGKGGEKAATTKAVEDLRTAFARQAARGPGQEVGVLTNQDADAFMAQIPSTTFQPELNAQKFRLLRDQVRAAKAAISGQTGGARVPAPRGQFAPQATGAPTAAPTYDPQTRIGELLKLHGGDERQAYEHMAIEMSRMGGQ